MVHIETVDLATRGVQLPNDCVGMVIAQPYLSLTTEEPYRCSPESKANQLAVLRDTLVVARAARHGAPKTHFTIFPEYSIPGVDGIDLVETALRAEDWPNGTIVIGGTDALSKVEFVSLAQAPRTYLDTTYNGLDRIDKNQWINCEITWVKGADGTVEKWLQPKLDPAWPERDVGYQDMFRGNSVFMFKGLLANNTQYRFSTLVCYDWIATVDDQKVWRWILTELQQQAAEANAELSLAWFFVIEHNRKPHSVDFLSEVRGFFDQTLFPTVRRDRTCLVFANSAGRPVPGHADLFGGTSLVFSPQTLFTDPTCHPTFCNGGSRFRSNSLLAAYHDILFRERGACIHSFLQINPNSLTPAPAGRTIALKNVFVFPLDGTDDPRVPAAQVPASIKWLNDELDSVVSLGDRYPEALLAAQAKIIHRQCVLELRRISPQAAVYAVKLAATESNDKTPDNWDRTEVDAVEHVVHTLDIIGLGFSHPTVGTGSAHAIVIINNQPVDLLAIRGNTHQACIEHSKTFLPLPRRQVLLVSRDSDNTHWRRKLGSFLQPITRQLGVERNITDPAGGLLHLGYHNLLDAFRNSAAAEALEGAINVELTT
jgi:hypothetical protein